MFSKTLESQKQWPKDFSAQLKKLGNSDHLRSFATQFACLRILNFNLF